MKLAVIVPILNESSILDSSLFQLKKGLHVSGLADAKVFLADGGSQDGSIPIASEFAMKSGWHFESEALTDPSVARTILIAYPKIPRSTDLVLILPCDTQLSVTAFKALKDAFENNRAHCGGFPKKYDPSSAILRLYQGLQNWIRLRFFKHVVWTNGIFFKPILIEAESFPSSGFLEDVMLSDRLRKFAGFRVIREPIVVSARRYYPNRTMSRILLNGFIMFLYRFRVLSVGRLKGLYLSLK